jgi:hypothetical protein
MAKCYSCGKESDQLISVYERYICPKCKLYVDLATNEVKRQNMMDKIAAIGMSILKDIMEVPQCKN